MAAFSWANLGSPIDTREQSLAAIKATSTIFLIFAGFGLVVFFALGYLGEVERVALLLPGVLIVGIPALLLRKFNSRGAALFLVVLNIINLGLLLAYPDSKASLQIGGNLISLWLSIRALYATNRLRDLES